MSPQEYALPAPLLGAALRERLGKAPTLCWKAASGLAFEPQGAGQISLGDVELDSGAQLHCTNGGRIRIGDDTYVGRGALLHAECEIVVGAGVKIAWDVVITDHLGLSEPGSGSARRVTIGDGAWIGAQAIVLGGSDIGAGAIIGAGAVVQGRIAPGAEVPGGDLSTG